VRGSGKHAAIVCIVEGGKRTHVVEQVRLRGWRRGQQKGMRSWSDWILAKSIPRKLTMRPEHTWMAKRPEVAIRRRAAGLDQTPSSSCERECAHKQRCWI
jgi:hypothetical protein